MFAHGSQVSVNYLKKPEKISYLLAKKSPTWRKMLENNEKITLTLYSCKTGQGHNSIALQIKRAYPNVTVVAPTKNITVEGYWFIKWHVTKAYIDKPGTWVKF